MLLAAIPVTRGSQGRIVKKAKEYEWTKFTPEVLQRGIEAFRTKLPKSKPGGFLFTSSSYEVSKGKEKWTFDNESEFYPDYRFDCDYAMVQIYSGSIHLNVFYHQPFGIPITEVSVQLKTREEIETVFNVFENGLSESAIARPRPLTSAPWESHVRIFIGHGQDPAWRDLKDHLAEKHQFKVETYETDIRVGHPISENLDLMLEHATFAILVLTGEMRDAEGKLHARENVIHELGLFQGKLGFNRAIPLVEESVTEFSNLHGMQQIRFAKGGMKETFGDVLAAIKKEFSSAYLSVAWVK